MEGLLYLHNLAGNALAKAEADMATLREENRLLREALAERDAGEPDAAN